MRDRRIGWALAAIGMLLVSTDSLFVRLAKADGWDIAFLVAAFSLPVHIVLNRRFETITPAQALRQTPVPLFAVAALAATSQIAFVTAVTRTDVSNVVVIVAAAPILAGVIGRFWFAERVRPRVWGAIAITVFGVLVVVSGSLGKPTLEGDLLAVLAIAAFALNLNVWRRYPEMSRFVGLGLSAVITLVVTAGFASPFAFKLETVLAAGAMGLVFNPAGRIAHTNAPRFAPAAEVALFTPIETVAATLWAWLAFSERPEVATFIGGAIVLVGVLFGTVAGKPRAH